jgi:hypothetical protein
LPINIDLSHLLPPFELAAVLFLLNPSLDVGADVFVRRRELYEPVPTYAHLVERILLSYRHDQVLLQLPPVNAFFHLLLGSDGLARLLLVHLHALLEHVLQHQSITNSS